MSAEEPTPTIYALRIMPRAEQDIFAATRYMASTQGEDAAQKWQEELFVAISSLGTLPRRCGLAPEEGFFLREVRQFAFRHRAGSAVYRIVFRVADGGPDAPTVFILHVRHSAQAPLSEEEARDIESAAE